VLGKGPRADDVALALSVGSDAIDVGRIDVALEALAWAKHEATRVGVVREALGVARYLDEDFAGALTELQAYRRISGRVDQNHLIADSLRALGRGSDRVIEPLEELLADERVSDDRRAEAVIVWAATLADDADLDGARALLRRHLGRAGAQAAAAHDLRVRVLAAELAERAGDPADARTHRNVIAQAEPELLELADLASEESGEPEAASEPDAPSGSDDAAIPDAAPHGDDTAPPTATPDAAPHGDDTAPPTDTGGSESGATDDDPPGHGGPRTGQQEEPGHGGPRTGQQDELPFET
jgi:hypothetical protein